MSPPMTRKRRRSLPKLDSRTTLEAKESTPDPSSTKRKATLFDDLDAAVTPFSSNGPDFITQGLKRGEIQSSLTSFSDEDFEDMPNAKRQKSSNSGDDDDDIEFEDVAAPSCQPKEAPLVTGDLKLTLTKEKRLSLTNAFGDKKGPTKREKMVRHATHCVHVMLLLWHNAVRNSWLCDIEIQAIMMSHVPPKIWDDIERWRHNSGLISPCAPPEPHDKNVRKGRGRVKGKPDQKSDPKDSPSTKHVSRDWGAAARKLEEGAIDVSHGDPLFRLMQSLVYWWKQRFCVTAPGLRKHGYMALERLDRLTKAHEAQPGDVSRFGERVENLEAFRKCAQSCQGSRDIGAQLFTSLLRGLGLEARMVANLPCLGFGWSKLEDAEAEKPDGPEKYQSGDNQMANHSARKKYSKTLGRGAETGPRSRYSALTQAVETANRDDLRLDHTDTDEESVVDVGLTSKQMAQLAVKIDEDLEYPHYWTEILSPVSNKYIPVDPIVKGTIATNRELMESFEPRGIKADKARQVMAYIVGYSKDGTAKDLTVRYLKKRMLPGRTKGVRLPPEKTQARSRKGKAERQHSFDWFTSVMSNYSRGDRNHPLTSTDREEDLTDLMPNQVQTKEVKEGEETLQYYKQSQEFVLERHLRREEVLKPGAAPVKVFRSKGKGGKFDEANVYLRADVVNVKSAETWHKQGRAPLPGEQPLKRVPYRAATLNRRREILEAEATTGEKVLQGLFSFEQTDWIIPPPIQNGVIPKNEYGNIDLFAEHMCPQGAVHVSFKGAMRVCKRLQIDFAEAVVDFEFGHRMAVPVIQGVVVAAEHHDRVMEELEKDEAERARKEDEKRRKAALGQWRRLIMGLRIRERIREEYGKVDDTISLFGRNTSLHAQKATAEDNERGEDMAGGFLPEGYEEESEEETKKQDVYSFFALGDDEGTGDGGLVVENESRVSQGATRGPADDEDIEASEEKQQRRSRRRMATKQST